MSGSAAGGEDHGAGQLYGDHPPAADGDDVFFQSHSACGGADDGGLTTSAYSSITDYLQGLLDPAELARHMDAPPCFPAPGDVIGEAATPVTPNSSTSGEAAGAESHGCKRGSPVPEEGDEDGSAHHHNHRYVCNSILVYNRLLIESSSKLLDFLPIDRSSITCVHLIC